MLGLESTHKANKKEKEKEKEKKKKKLKYFFKNYFILFYFIFSTRVACVGHHPMLNAKAKPILFSDLKKYVLIFSSQLSFTLSLLKGIIGITRLVSYSLLVNRV